MVENQRHKNSEIETNVQTEKLFSGKLSLISDWIVGFREGMGINYSASHS